MITVAACSSAPSSPSRWSPSRLPVARHGPSVPPGGAERRRPVMAAFLMLAAAVFVAINLVVDLLYAVVDPRLRSNRREARRRERQQTEQRPSSPMRHPDAHVALSSAGSYRRGPALGPRDGGASRAAAVGAGRRPGAMALAQNPYDPGELDSSTRHLPIWLDWAADGPPFVLGTDARAGTCSRPSSTARAVAGGRRGSA